VNDESASAELRSPREIERDIEHLRTRLDRSLAELDRRRHELTNVKLQMRKHPAVFIGAGAVAGRDARRGGVRGLPFAEAAGAAGEGETAADRHRPRGGSAGEGGARRPSGLGEDRRRGSARPSP